MLPAFLFGLFFLVPAWWLWNKPALRTWAVLPLLTALIVVGFTIALKLDDVNNRQLSADVDVLLQELSQADLLVGNDLSPDDGRLLLASLGSQAIYRAAPLVPARKAAIDSVLYRLAAWAADARNLRQWGRNANWDREVFFLAHAGAVIGHYQLITRDETFAKSFKSIGEHLGKRLERGRYKHLPSRPNEDYFRPADNAAAMYTIALYDAYYGTSYLTTNFKDWTDYLEDELYFAESRLPCAAFSATNRCQLEPTATATGLYIAYRAAARPAAVQNDIPWREWLHYFGQTSLSPFSLSIRPNMRDGKRPRFCDQGAYPLNCDTYETVVGLWAAAEYRAHYTYFRLYAANALRRWFFSPVNFAELSVPRRTQALTKVAIRAIGEGYRE